MSFQVVRAGGSCKERRLLQPIKTIINCGQQKLRPGSSWARQTEGKVEARESASARASARATPAPLSLSHTHTHTRRSATCDDRGYFPNHTTTTTRRARQQLAVYGRHGGFCFSLWGRCCRHYTYHTHARARTQVKKHLWQIHSQPAALFFPPFSSPPLFFAVSRVRGAIAHPLPLSSPLPER